MNSNQLVAAASAWKSLVSCLPALEAVELRLPESLQAADMGCLLEALAWLPRLTTLELCMMNDGLYADVWYDEEGNAPKRFPDAPAFAKLQGLTKLALAFGMKDDSPLGPPRIK